MKNKPWILLVGVLIQVINAISVEATGTPFDAMYHVAFLKQQLREVAAVLACDAGD
jgi:hypothetical protein